MVVAVWSVKGGVGVTSVAALLAVGQAERAEETLLVDLAGHVPMVLGCDDAPTEPGIAEWTAMAKPTAEALGRIAIEARRCLYYVPRGTGPIGDLAALLPQLNETRQVIVDCGVVTDPASVPGELVAAAEQSLLVVRECYLTLRLVQESALTPTGVVVIKEQNRRLGRPDVESAAGAPVVAQLSVDSDIADALDTGLINAHLPRRLIRQMGRALHNVA